MVATSATHQHKRHGKHQKQTKHFLKVYWPYLPLAVILSIGLVFSVLWKPRNYPNVLAYATSMSTSSLLQATNQDRVANGEVPLTLNSQLNQAAQAKANDMASRDYWSHNTPEGTPPWTFITNAGYRYKSAGENLAYGFASSDDTVAGWMNSPEHKANILNSNFVDVGFGYANSADYQGSGPETIVVAYYASPLTTQPVTAAPNKPAAPANSAQPQTKADTQTAPATTTPAPAAAAPISAAVPSTTKPSSLPATPSAEPASQSVSRLAVLTHGSLPWLASVVSATVILGIAVLTVRHALAIRKWILHGERYVLHHMIFDITIVSLVGLCLIASQSTGLFVR